MPRMMRFEFPGSLVHIMARGLDGKKIFLDIDDRQVFLTILTREITQCGYRCLAWCLQSNHYHLFLRTNENPMSSLMRPLNSGYARWFNDKHNRRGYLFQDRFKSVLCQDQGYARQLIRYIHLNPIRSGEVVSLKELRVWPWCGHGYLLNAPRANGCLFQDHLETLRRFGNTPENAVQSYVTFLEQGIHKGCSGTAGQLPDEAVFEISGSHKGWPAVIGDAEFAKEAMLRHEVSTWRKHRQVDYKNALESIAVDISKSCGVSYDQLFEKGRQDKRSKARETFCYRAHHEEKIPFVAIARFLGTTITPVVFLARHGKERTGVKNR
jgi:putative transposase